MPRSLLCVLALPLCCAAAESEDWIGTDRPDFVDAPAVVGKGRVQLETGWLQSKEARSTPWMLRLGVSDDVELRAESDGRLAERGAAGHARGWGDVALSAKWLWREAEGGAPAIGLIGQLDLSTGSREFRGEGTRPSLRLPLEWDLPHDLNLGVMPGIYLDRNERGRRISTGQFGITVAKNFGERAYTFVELAAPRIARGRDGGSTASFDFGGGYSLTRDLHVDVGVMLGLNRRTPDRALTVGLSVRL
ncbi:transporter [Pseudoduganella sp. OTU4001]|uniref:transporter n=1 Tax=Pseudoduganella sp. OTU4001 TaxID=3043854 RepID=UPI00313D5FB7